MRSSKYKKLQHVPTGKGGGKGAPSEIKVNQKSGGFLLLHGPLEEALAAADDRSTGRELDRRVPSYVWTPGQFRSPLVSE